MKSFRINLLTSQSLPPLQCELLWIYRGKPDYIEDPGEEFETATSIFFVEQGSISLKWAEGSAICRAGDLFLSRLGPRQQVFSPNAELLSIGYHFSWASEKPIFDEGLNRHLPGNGAFRSTRKKLYQSSVDLFHKIYGNLKKQNLTRAMLNDTATIQNYANRNAAFAEWLRILVESFAIFEIPAALPLAQNSIVRQAKYYIDSHPLNHPLHYSELLSVMNVGWRRLQQLFQSEMHITPSDYFEKRRLYYARIRLKEPNISVKEVASELGFKNLSHFSIWFKRHFNLSPRLFQKGSA
jgi:AraC-like DNA-binding protein